MAKYAAITGKYIYVTVEGIEYRVYFEEAGTGIPIVCPAYRRFRWQTMETPIGRPRFNQRFRFIAIDLPYHGKSLPPDSVRFWEQKYELHKEWFMKFWIELIRELELVRPVYMGCSMGGHLAGDLALNYPDEFTACIGLEASAGG